VCYTIRPQWSPFKTYVFALTRAPLQPTHTADPAVGVERGHNDGGAFVDDVRMTLEVHVVRVVPQRLHEVVLARRREHAVLRTVANVQITTSKTQIW